MTSESLLGQLGPLPSLPDIYYRVEDVLSNPDYSLEQLAETLQSDPSMTARLLKLANSAYYQFPGKIETVHRATTVIGAREIQELVLATSVITVFQGMPVGPISMRSFWEHSIACGLTARAIAAHRREANIERFYVMGLLHDIGRLALCLAQPELMGELLVRHKSEQIPLVELESGTFGACHGEIGGSLLSSWQLPQSLCDAVMEHHGNGEKKELPLEAAITHVADMIVNAMAMGSSGNSFTPRLSDSAWQQVGLDITDLHGIVSVTSENLREVVTAFLEGE